MPPLPPEVIRNIILHLISKKKAQLYELEKDAAQYAAVNKFWQDVVESQTFAGLWLDQNRVDQVNEIVSGRRRKYVQFIQLDFKLPPEDEEASSQARLVNPIFTLTLVSFFRQLSSWTEDQTRPGGIVLWSKFPPPTPARSVFNLPGSLNLPAARLESHHEPLPEVNVISELRIPSQEHPTIGIHDVAMATILSSLSGVRHATLKVDSEVNDIPWHQEIRGRRNFAEALDRIRHPPQMLDMTGSGQDRLSSNRFILRRGSRPEAVDEADLHDSLSASLRALSQRGVETLTLGRIAIGDDLFWPSSPPSSSHSGDAAGLPRWESLRVLVIGYDSINPSYRGRVRWEYFEDPDVADSELDSDGPEPQARATPAMQDFYIAAGRAARVMPQLECMELKPSFPMSGRSRHKFRYWVTEEEGPVATWTSYPEFQPEQRVLEVWREVALEVHGKELDVRVA